MNNKKGPISFSVYKFQKFLIDFECKRPTLTRNKSDLVLEKLLYNTHSKLNRSREQPAI